MGEENLVYIYWVGHKVLLGFSVTPYGKTWINILANTRQYQPYKGIPAICDNMNKPWGHYAKWNKPVKEEQILHNSTCLSYLK